MTHISSELLNDKNLSLWLATIALLAFSAGYSLASIRHSGTAELTDTQARLGISDLAMGKYGHLSRRP